MVSKLIQFNPFCNLFLYSLKVKFYYYPVLLIWDKCRCDWFANDKSEIFSSLCLNQK